MVRYHASASLGSLRIREYDADAATIHADVVIALDHSPLELFGFAFIAAAWLRFGGAFFLATRLATGSRLMRSSSVCHRGKREASSRDGANISVSSDAVLDLWVGQAMGRCSELGPS